MPLSIEITLNILWLPILCIIFALGGYAFRKAQLQKLKKVISQLEKRALQSDAEILALEKENCILQEQIKNNAVPVIPMTGKENPENLPDSNTRKKMLGKSTANHHT